jgi:hypothetical protein
VVLGNNELNEGTRYWMTKCGKYLSLAIFLIRPKLATRVERLLSRNLPFKRRFSGFSLPQNGKNLLRLEAGQNVGYVPGSRHSARLLKIGCLWPKTVVLHYVNAAKDMRENLRDTD